MNFFKKDSHSTGGGEIILEEKINFKNFRESIFVLILLFLMGICISTSYAANSNDNNEYSIKEVEEMNGKLADYVSKNDKLANHVGKGNEKLDMNEMSYLLCKATNQIENKNTKPIKIADFKNPSYPHGDRINGKIYKKEYLRMSNNIVNFLDKYKKSPNYVKTSLGNLQFQSFVYMYVRCLDFHKSHKRLPNYVYINSNSQTKINKYLPKDISKTIAKPIPKAKVKTTPTPKNKNLDWTVNNHYKTSSINYEKKQEALKQTKNAPFTSKIKYLSKNLVKNAKSEYEKAKILFDYVKNNIKYLRYHNTVRGAEKTLTYKQGNCVDQSHLLISMARSSGIPARYVHGTCKFNSGYIGHVWTQLLVGNIWYVADPVSKSNSFGVIKNWNIKKSTIKNKYISLPF